MGLIIDSQLSWGEQIITLASKLNKACYAIRVVKSCMSLEVLRTIYFSYAHSAISYGIIFWGNSHFSTNIFKVQKRIIRIITNTGRCNSCHLLFKQLQILSLPSQYIFSLVVFVNKNRELFLSNSEIHDINTWYNHDLHLPSTNLTLVKKKVSCILEAKFTTAYHWVLKLSPVMLNVSKLHLRVTYLRTVFIV